MSPETKLLQIVETDTGKPVASIETKIYSKIDQITCEDAIVLDDHEAVEPPDSSKIIYSGQIDLPEKIITTDEEYFWYAMDSQSYRTIGGKNPTTGESYFFQAPYQLYLDLYHKVLTITNIAPNPEP